MDGTSCIFVTASTMHDYSLEYFIKMPPVSLIAQIFLKVSCVYYMPVHLLKAVLLHVDDNILTRGKKNMQGIITASTGKKINMKEYKDLSKKLGVTINDILVSSTAAALKDLFKKLGDPLGHKPDGEGMVNFMMPANIRFNLYPDRESVKPENKFGGITIRIPLFSKIQDNYKPISKLTSQQKN